MKEAVVGRATKPRAIQEETKNIVEHEEEEFYAFVASQKAGNSLGYWFFVSGASKNMANKSH